MFDYNDENKAYAKEEIDQFSSDFGGTEIFEPLEKIFSLKL
jgi:hypothetical protein